MRKLAFVFIVAFAFSTTAMAVDIAISTQANWWGQAAADREMQEIVDNVTAVAVERFSSTELDALAQWVEEHTGDGIPDLLIMCGAFPATLYPAGNTQTDGSLAELFLDDGNTIVNTGDYMFYVGTDGNNDAGGLQNMMDIGSITMWDDDTACTVTADGQELTPSLQNLASDRPFHLDELEGDWEVELILAQNDAGTRADPVIVRNSDTGGRLGIFFQTASQDDDPRGEVISEWINNWYLATAGGGGNPYARRPDPEDGALFENTWGNLSWRAGHYAVSHDVYMGTSFDDVNDGAADTFVGNSGQTMQIVGFAGFPVPDGLVPGTTYYWRVDEVNDANVASPWKGDVWSFSITPNTGFDPVPADVSKFVVTEDLALSWTPGFNARLHTVYFGESFDEVDAAVAGLPQANTTFAPGALEPEKTYYWRVDEFDVTATHKGPVWSFTTARVGGGVKGEYFQGMSLGGSAVLSRTDAQIDFSWGDAEADPAVGADNYSARWTGEVEAAFTETYTFYTNTDDGARLWIGGQLLVDRWVDQGTTEHRGTIDLVAGNTYSLVMEYYENGGGAVAQLLWSSPSTQKQIIPQAALSFLVHANSPSPSNGTVGVKLISTLGWAPGDSATSHEVYFGTDADAVANATKASPEYKGSKAIGAESLDPGTLAWDTNYFWRVDEVDSAGPGGLWVGNVWTFDTGDFLIVEDFEDYNDFTPDEVWNSWLDGFGTTTNGATAGYATPDFAGGEHYVETTIVHGGAQSLPYLYDNNLKTSEATLTLVYPRDWTAEGVTKLSLWIRGSTANAADRMFIALNGTAVVYHADAAATQLTGWNEWVIDLADFAGVNLTNVNTITIGVGTKNSPAAGGTGTVFIDDLRLTR